jgi:hypothetical protein
MNETGTTDQNTIDAIRREAERLEEDAVYSSKGHFNAESTWMRINYCLGIPATILAALAGATLIKNCPEFGSIAALLASLLTGLMTFIKPNERAVMHRTAGGEYLALRNNVRLFREIEIPQSNQLEKLIMSLKQFSEVRNDINKKSLGIPHYAFIIARKGIEEGQAIYNVDKKI